ncbi:hypothetical protein JGU71_20075 [Antrihabitans sp. YC3-6]|uniref:Uncharacterized protein n=1 Tax=Antrihabitans stalagmiti TaxID=2799499 RepID=A0A934U551_9NOCA|nr:hypothetical protein [Antrihabitans stalagmiti]MBJ8341189.1 hypothetical protein [Antrihabitans stalagmiti]
MEFATVARLQIRVESHSDTTAPVAHGSKPNRILHLILTLVTCGFRGINWIAIAFIQKERRVALTVNEYAQVTMQTHS